MEERTIEVVQAAVTGWLQDRRPRATVIALLAYDSASPGGVPPALQLPSGSFDRPLRTRVDEARKRFIRHARMDNNGIKEPNVLSLLLPAGVPEYVISTQWLADLNSFGRIRGETAHQSLRTQQPLDPRDELQKVRNIVNGFAPIDVLLEQLRTRS